RRPVRAAGRRAAPPARRRASRGGLRRARAGTQAGGLAQGADAAHRTRRDRLRTARGRPGGGVMTDETTARDRAIERAYTVALGEITSAAISTPADTLAMRVVLALLARPEVLRALAGAPTADVAGKRENQCGSCSQHVLVDRLRHERERVLVALR